MNGSQYAGPLHPVWLDGRVPNGFWQSASNRRAYLLWLGERLGFQTPEDWYRITTADIQKNRGGGLLSSYWSNSAVLAVKEVFRHYDWKEWLFGSAPRGFWDDPNNRRRYMDWLGDQLGIKVPDDWYAVTNEDFARHKGAAFLIFYRSTVSAAVMAHLPNHLWKPWLFNSTPKGFWRDADNCRQYMKWLGQRLGFKRPHDWYRVTLDDFDAHDGRQFLRHYNDSPVAAVKDFLPRHEWHEWKFVRVPLAFWESPRNRNRYLGWLGRKLGFRRHSDWLQIRRHHFVENYGGGLLARYHSYIDAVRELLPAVARRLEVAAKENG